MALRNTIRRPARFWLAIGLLASAGMVFVAGVSLGSGTKAIAEQQKQQTNWDVDIQLANPADLDQVTTMVQGLPDVRRVEGFQIAQTGVAGPGQIPVTSTYPDQGHGRVSVTAFPAGTTTLPAQRTMLDGRWLNPDETGAVVLNQITRNNTVPDVKAGDTVQLVLGGKSTSWRVVGIVQEREGGGGGVYATAKGFANAVGQSPKANQLRIVTANHDEQTRDTVAASVNKTLTDAGLPVQSAASVSRKEAISSGHLDPVAAIVVVIAIAMGVVGAIGLASMMSANILDRIREFGVMHAIGASPKTVRRIVVAEGLFLAIASCLVAAVPALVLTKILGVGLGNLFMDVPLPYRISAVAVGIWVVLALLGAVLATDASASRAARLTVREALTYL